jgi:hypothetical protein
MVTHLKWKSCFPQHETKKVNIIILIIIIIKVILLADSIRSRLMAWFGSPIIKKIPKCHPPNVYGYVEIRMYIMSKYSTVPNCSKFDFLVHIFYIGSLKPWENNLCLIYLSTIPNTVLKFYKTRNKPKTGLNI